MSFNPKKAWDNIKQLAGEETSHHSAPTLIKMRLPPGQLAENDEENVSVFASHFKRVLNNHKLTEREVINDIDLRKVMRELDVPPPLVRVHQGHHGVDQQQSSKAKWYPTQRLQANEQGETPEPF